MSKQLLKKIESIKLCLLAHPDNKENSEFSDRISDLEELEKEVSSFECVVLYRQMQGDKELHQSYHKGKTKDEALKDFFDTIGEKGINVLWLNNR